MNGPAGGIAQADAPSPTGKTAGSVAEASALEFVDGPVQGSTIYASESEFTIGLSSTSLTPGTYTFAVTNTGAAPHDLVITGPSVDARTPILNGGASAELTMTLDTGVYEVWCSVPDHRMLGMNTTITVS